RVPARRWSPYGHPASGPGSNEARRRHDRFLYTIAGSVSRPVGAAVVVGAFWFIDRVPARRRHQRDRVDRGVDADRGVRFSCPLGETETFGWLLRRDLEVPLGQLVEHAGRGHESALLRVPTPGIADGGLAVFRRLLAFATVGLAGLGLGGEGYVEAVVLRPLVGARRVARFLSAVVAAHSFAIDEQGRDLVELAAAQEQRRHHLIALVGIAV